MKGFIAGVVVTVALLVGIVLIVANFGLYPTGADNPPGRLEQALGMRAMDVYADKHKPAGDNPIAPIATNLTEGAKGYEDHCAWCHGGANTKIGPMQNQFSPPAPQLIDHVQDEAPSWLFWVTQHGVRMTGMPAWGGILSDEDTWKIVAFIKNSDKLKAETEASLQAGATNP